MTIKTNKVLSEADIIFYDDLLESNCLKKYSGETLRDERIKKFRNIAK